MADFRIDVGFFNHIKTKRLRKRLGLEGVFALQMLWAYAAQHEHDESRVYSKEDIELAVDWAGKGDIASALCEIGFTDCADGGYKIHEWAIHNGYAATAAKRSEAGRTAANARWEKRRQCDGNADALPEQNDGNAPSPVPSPSPVPVIEDEISEWILKFQKQVVDYRGASAPKITDTFLKSCRESVDEMIRIDGMTFEQIKDVMEWAARDSFWGPNAMSLAGLRRAKDGVKKIQRIMAEKDRKCRPMVPHALTQAEINAMCAVN